MKGRLILMTLLAGGLMTSSCGSEEPHPVVTMNTSMGAIEITLDREKAPATVKNFLRYVEEGFFDSTLIHRVVPRFVIQGGGFDTNLRKKATHDPIAYEETGMSNVRGTIAMARTQDLDSATSQFFINLLDNIQLDGMKYTVFGEVTAGMAVVDSIATLETINTGGAFTNGPVVPVVVESVKVK